MKWRSIFTISGSNIWRSLSPRSPSRIVDGDAEAQFAAEADDLLEVRVALELMALQDFRTILAAERPRPCATAAVSPIA